jgi:hypothetical protein
MIAWGACSRALFAYPGPISSEITSIAPPVGVVTLDRFAEALQIGADQLREGDEQREVEGGQVHQPFAELVKCAVGEAVELVDRLLEEVSDVCACELLLRWSALLAAAVFGLAA